MEGVRVGGGLEEQQGLFKYVCTTCEHTLHTDIRTYVHMFTCILTSLTGSSSQHRYLQGSQ